MKLIVDIADLKVSGNAEDIIITYALGSCLGLVVFDPRLKIGGILHAMLPEGKEKRSEPDFNPYKYVDTGVPLLFKECYKFGATKRSLKIYAFGCANMTKASSAFLNIGDRNYAALNKILWKNNAMIDKEDIGGDKSRTIELMLSEGIVNLKDGRNVKEIF
jgi:chemotaxis protein CheD